MFSKISRYYGLSDVTTLDAQGRLLPSKRLRLSSTLPATFQHTVKAVDRLDHLAYQYYKQPRKWWKICDANPDVMSPQALLGKLPLVTQRFWLSFEHEPPPWYILQQKLLGTVGVEAIQIVEEIQLISEIQQGKTIHLEEYIRALVITFNQMKTGTDRLEKIITEGVAVVIKKVENVERVGKPIFIPPDSIKVSYGS